MVSGVCLLLTLRLIPSVVATRAPSSDDQVVEIDFEPVGPDDQGPIELIEAGPDGRSPIPMGPGGPSAEDVLDAMLGPPDQGRGQSGPHDPQGPMGMMIPHDMRSSIPASTFQQFFPQPIMIEEDDDGPRGGMPPDALLQDMMKEMDQAFTQKVLPAAQSSPGATGKFAADACTSDYKQYCQGVKSQLHCLGKHANVISDACTQTVSKSVPFLCSDSIDQFCDVLENGILSCLEKNMPKLEGMCRDAVVTTRHLITKVNTQRASVTNPSTGERQTSTPKGVAAASKKRETTLDLGLGGLGSMLEKSDSASSHAGEAFLDLQMTGKKAPPPPPAPPVLSKVSDSASVPSKAVSPAPKSARTAANESSHHVPAMMIMMIIVAVGVFFMRTQRDPKWFDGQRSARQGLLPTISS